jgi:thioredoxin-related protein
LLGDNILLEKEYKEKNIAFISMALNDNKEKWSSYISKNLDEFGNENYFITNTKSSKIIENWNIQSIPRYILFDKNGEVLYIDAPRPNTKEVRMLFNKLLQ